MGRVVFYPLHSIEYLCNKESKMFNLQLPTNWAELSDKMLRIWREQMANVISV